MRAAFTSSKPIADAIEQSGYAVVQAFLDLPLIANLAEECGKLVTATTSRAARIGRGTMHTLRSDIRGDRTHWFDADLLSVPQSSYWDAMQALRIELNRALMLGLEEFEAHYALYAPGAGYARHRDRFRDNDARVLSSVLYLNPDWREDDGGALRLYLPDSTDRHLDVYPHAGTLVLFLSADFEHEVLPATRDRFSIAGWFRRRR